MYKKIKISIALIIVIILIFILYCTCNTNPKPYEGFVSGQCPTTLIKKGNQILLYNPEMAKVPGVNPIQLSSLKDYEKYLKWQRANGLDCPILHLEQVFDTQGNAQYEVRNSFLQNEPVGPLNHDLPNLHKPPCPQDTINASLDNSPFNRNMIPPIDPQNQDIGNGGLFNDMDSIINATN